jgi:hypothetical protein
MMKSYSFSGGLLDGRILQCFGVGSIDGIYISVPGEKYKESYSSDKTGGSVLFFNGNLLPYEEVSAWGPTCPDCGSFTIDNCPACGAPQCCPKCCHAELLKWTPSSNKIE